MFEQIFYGCYFLICKELQGFTGVDSLLKSLVQHFCYCLESIEYQIPLIKVDYTFLQVFQSMRKVLGKT